MGTSVLQVAEGFPLPHNSGHSQFLKWYNVVKTDHEHVSGNETEMSEKRTKTKEKQEQKMAACQVSEAPEWLHRAKMRLGNNLNSIKQTNKQTNKQDQGTTEETRGEWFFRRAGDEINTKNYWK